MSDIFREVDEEVRQDQAIAFWNKYQNLIVALAALAIVVAGGWRYWQYRQQQAASAADQRYQAAALLSRDGKTDEALKEFDALAKEAPRGYAMLSRMRAAAEAAVKDKAAGVKAFDALASDSSADPLFRDVARLRAAMLRVDDADRKEMEDRLTPLAAAGAAFRSSARELLALVAIRDNDFDTAGKWLDEIVTDNDAPATLKQRADAFLGIVRSDRQPGK
ncbi:MAG: tetratricopeptide repeat protein [Hyphomicrobiales bacterium]|nr:tetratricopeptide repeat protein [Hyphomicrobiales bacterium]